VENKMLEEKKKQQQQQSSSTSNTARLGSHAPVWSTHILQMDCLQVLM
jgi:hypothetical protein